MSKPSHIAYVVIQPPEGSNRRPPGIRSAQSGPTRKATVSTS